MSRAYLTSGELARFRASQQRFLTGLAVAAGYCVGVVLADEFVVPLDPYGLWITIGGFVFIIAAIYCTRCYRCPVCGQMPMTGGILSVGSSDAAYSSMVALFPRRCRKCGVRFEVEPSAAKAGSDRPAT